MPFKLLQEEKRYLDILKETKMLKHVGRGVVSKAPKEKEASTSTDKSDGQGTVQAGTMAPNQVPKVKDIAKYLAKEGIDINELTVDELSEMLFPDNQPPRAEITQEEVDQIVDGAVEQEINDILEGK